MKIIRLLSMAVVASLLVATFGCVNPEGSPQTQHGIDLYVQAVAAYHNGDRAVAISKLNEATKSDPNLRMARSLLGDLYRDQGKYSDAVPQYEALARLDPYGASNQYRLGLTYQWISRLQDAAAAYLKALELNPRDAQSSTNLGLVYMALGKMDDSLKYVKKATELNPRSAAAWSNYGVVLDAMGKAADAEVAYRKSLELNRGQDAILVNLGANLTRQKKSAEAINVMSEAVKRFDNAVTHKLYGDAFASADRFDDAMAEYDIALKKDPRYYPAMNEKATVLINQYRKGMELDDQKKTTALNLWKQSLALNPQQPRIQATLNDWSQQRLFAK
ncbi:MAG TPA: tetratricopeptide repeat protein [Tepidisphaeraceae bacterium]|jgi:tetratricopeptide (TPR) repeat protein|nr:tetratricopeptide repeat protein [Tepidisphaeraceae bacterium]